MADRTKTREDEQPRRTPKQGDKKQGDKKQGGKKQGDKSGSPGNR